jgi:hypothetical protein
MAARSVDLSMEIHWGTLLEVNLLARVKVRVLDFLKEPTLVLLLETRKGSTKAPQLE